VTAEPTRAFGQSGYKRLKIRLRGQERQRSGSAPKLPVLRQHLKQHRSALLKIVISLGSA
jgi:hypothetical protein